MSSSPVLKVRVRRSPGSSTSTDRSSRTSARGAPSVAAIVLGAMVVGAIVFSAGERPAEAQAKGPDVRRPTTAQRSSPVVYDSEMVVAVTAPYRTKLLRVWLPIPPDEPGQQLLATELSTFPESVAPKIEAERLFGNRFAYFEFPNPQGAQLIRHKFRIRVWELRWNLDPARIEPVERWPAEFAPYLRSESQGVVADERFSKLLDQILPQRSNPLTDLRTVLDWTGRSLQYDHVDASLQASSTHALEKRRGHCSDYHGLCAALGRVMAQPTRIAYGINPFPKASPSHCKLEVYLEPYGWVSFDVSETQKLVQSFQADAALSETERRRLIDAAHRRLTAGFRDNTWFVQTRGTDYELAPPAGRRAAVVRTIYAEADGKPLPEPDPSNSTSAAFAWMTAHRFDPDVKVDYPFTGPGSLQSWLSAP